MKGILLENGIYGTIRSILSFISIILFLWLGKWYLALISCILILILSVVVEDFSRKIIRKHHITDLDFYKTYCSKATKGYSKDMLKERYNLLKFRSKLSFIVYISDYTLDDKGLLARRSRVRLMLYKGKIS